MSETGKMAAIDEFINSQLSVVKTDQRKLLDDHESYLSSDRSYSDDSPISPMLLVKNVVNYVTKTQTNKKQSKHQQKSKRKTNKNNNSNKANKQKRSRGKAPDPYFWKKVICTSG